MAQGVILPKCTAISMTLPWTMPLLPCKAMTISQYLCDRFPEGVQYPVLDTLAPYVRYTEKWTGQQSSIINQVVAQKSTGLA